MQKNKEVVKLEQQERLIKALEDIAFSIDVLGKRQAQDYSQLLMNIFISLKGLEKTLNEYCKIGQQHLD